MDERHRIKTYLNAHVQEYDMDPDNCDVRVSDVLECSDGRGYQLVFENVGVYTAETQRHWNTLAMHCGASHMYMLRVDQQSVRQMYVVKSKMGSWRGYKVFVLFCLYLALIWLNPRRWIPWA